MEAVKFILMIRGCSINKRQSMIICCAIFFGLHNEMTVIE